MRRNRDVNISCIDVCYCSSCLFLKVVAIEVGNIVTFRSVHVDKDNHFIGSRETFDSVWTSTWKTARICSVIAN